MIRQYRKKPVVIEAVQWTGTNGREVARFIGATDYGDPIAIEIRTLEGVMTVSKGDYVIKGVKGEFYPCKPDIFAQTYEEVALEVEGMLPGGEYLR